MSVRLQEFYPKSESVQESRFPAEAFTENKSRNYQPVIFPENPAPLSPTTAARGQRHKKHRRSGGSGGLHILSVHLQEFYPKSESVQESRFPA